jgi:hypothetical protein
MRSYAPSQFSNACIFYRCMLHIASTTTTYAATLSPNTNTKMSSPSKLPAWPLTNMGNAEFTATDNAFVGENTVIGEYIYCEGFNGCIIHTCHVPFSLLHLFSYICMTNLFTTYAQCRFLDHKVH